MKRIIATLFLAAFASASFAQVSDESGSTHVANWQNCPADTTPNAYYKWQDGHLVRDGWDCQRNPSPQ
jgi:hypothetical protein